TGGSNASTQFGEVMEHELRMKREAAEKAFEAQAEKDRTVTRLEELRFLATSTKDLDDVDAYWIKKQKRLIRNKMKNDLGAEEDEDEGFYENKEAIKTWTANRFMVQKQAKDDLLQALADWDIKAENISQLILNLVSLWTRFNMQFGNVMASTSSLLKLIGRHLIVLTESFFNGQKWRKWIGACRTEHFDRTDRTGPNVFRSGPWSGVLDQFGLRSGLTKNPKIMACRTGPDRRPTRTGPFRSGPRYGVLDQIGLGLKINLSKSRLFGVGVPEADVEMVASSLGCTHDFVPFMYLGLLVGVEKASAALENHAVILPPTPIVTKAVITIQREETGLRHLACREAIQATKSTVSQNQKDTSPQKTI
nr:RNA-directed DNA polymerase, eukaryota [Tanacetum cinerariifolium]